MSLLSLTLPEGAFCSGSWRPCRSTVCKCQSFNWMHLNLNYNLLPHPFTFLSPSQSGLNLAPVARLRSSWEKLPSKYEKLFGDLQGVFDPSRNMSKYRNLLSSQSMQPPIIPLFPVVKKDLTFLHEGTCQNHVFCGHIFSPDAWGLRNSSCPYVDMLLWPADFLCAVWEVKF